MLHPKPRDERVDKAQFEAGIKLGALFHQFVGTPVGFENVEILERAMESCVKLQPYVEEVKVKIDRVKLREKLSAFGYTSLSPDMLHAEVVVKVGKRRVRAVLRWDERLKYPIMEIR